MVQKIVIICYIMAATTNNLNGILIQKRDRVKEVFSQLLTTVSQPMLSKL